MKGVKKIILRNADVLNDQQMKSIFGGSGSSGSVHDYCNDICTKDSECGGSCPHCVKVANWSGTKVCNQTI